MVNDLDDLATGGDGKPERDEDDEDPVGQEFVKTDDPDEAVEGESTKSKLKGK